MRIEQLRCMEAVAKTGSFSKAAEQLFITHQAVGKNMKQLEEEIGVTLFSKTNRGIEFTAAGEDVLQFAKETLQRKSDLEQKLLQYKTPDETKEKELRICSASAVTSIVLPNVLAKLYAQKKNLRIKIISVNQFEDIVTALRNGQHDLALLSISESEAAKKILDSLEDLKIEVLARDELVAIMKRQRGTMPEPSHAYRAVFSITPLDDNYRQISGEQFTISSVDLEFHKTLLEKMNAVVTMPGLAQQNFFSSKRYVQTELEKVTSMDVLHIAITRKDADDTVKSVLNLVRQELYIK